MYAVFFRAFNTVSRLWDAGCVHTFRTITSARDCYYSHALAGDSASMYEYDGRFEFCSRKAKLLELHVPTAMRDRTMLRIRNFKAGQRAESLRNQATQRIRLESVAELRNHSLGTTRTFEHLREALREYEIAVKRGEDCSVSLWHEPTLTTEHVVDSDENGKQSAMYHYWLLNCSESPAPFGV